LGHLAQAFLVVSLPLSALWASHQSKQAPIPNTSLSQISETTSRIAQRFKFAKMSEDEKQEDLESGSRYTPTSFDQGNKSVETTEIA
jgi:hypothetical protein